MDGRNGIISWLHKYDLLQYVSQVTGEKPKATAYIDDRSVAFTPRAMGSEAAWQTAVEDVLRIAQYEGHGSAQ